jgi:hypothetical protein
LDTAEIARGYQVEADLEKFISQRHEKRVQTEGERLEEEMYSVSVRRYQECERRQIRAERYGWHCDQAERLRRTLEALIAHHEQQAEKLCEETEPPKGAA